MKTLSINTKIKVRLTPIGQKLWFEKHKSSQDKMTDTSNTDGYTEMKLIELLTLFENYMYLGDINKPFNGEIIIID